MRGSIEGCGVQNIEAKRTRQGRIKLDCLDMGLFTGDLGAYLELQLVDIRETC